MISHDFSQQGREYLAQVAYRFCLLPLVFLLFLSINRPLLGLSHPRLHLLRMFSCLLPTVVTDKYILFQLFEETLKDQLVYSSDYNNELNKYTTFKRHLNRC